MVEWIDTVVEAQGFPGGRLHQYLKMSEEGQSVQHKITGALYRLKKVPKIQPGERNDELKVYQQTSEEKTFLELVDLFEDD